MIAKRRTIGGSKDNYSQLRSQLADILTNRAQGLLTQREYEEKLEEFEQVLPGAGRLVEHDLPRGGTRFILREARSGRILEEFEFHRGHEIDE
jgi:hypothetical protein